VSFGFMLDDAIVRAFFIQQITQLLVDLIYHGFFVKAKFDLFSDG
jgi:hypothetical protein